MSPTVVVTPKYGVHTLQCNIHAIKPIIADDLTVTPYQQVILVKKKINEIIVCLHEIIHGLTELSAHALETDEEIKSLKEHILRIDDRLSRI
jgi:hypothetical protein